MNEDDICVTKTEQLATYRQVITPNGTGTVGEIIAALLEVYKVNRITGPIVLNVNQGGVRNIVADQLAKVPEGSEADIALEHLFGR